jgi:molybdate transport system substrate-binding protein
MRFLLRQLSLIFAVVIGLPSSAYAEKIVIAAASDLKFAMDEVVQSFKKTGATSTSTSTSASDDVVEVVYGSSGNFFTQIQQGAPYDLFFSADIALPQALFKNGFAASEVTPYGVGRLVLWSTKHDKTSLSVENLSQSRFVKIAIANPAHAPYGKRAEEALRSAKVWDAVQSKLVLGDNITQAALYAQTGNADVGLIALSLALNPRLASKGVYTIVPEQMHQPISQGFVITKRAENNPLAARFGRFMAQPETLKIMKSHGFSAPEPSQR